jgi:hypothetical protein
VPTAKQPRTGRQVAFRVLAVVVGVAFIIFGIQERLALRHTRSGGMAAVVDPIDGYSKRRSKGLTTYSAEFTFKTATGQVVVKRRTFPEELIKDFEQRRPVKVVYDPRSPSDFVFEKESASWIPPLVGTAFIVAALFFL